ITVMRQFLALVIFSNSIIYFYQKKYWRTILLFICMILIHRSSIFLLVFYPFANLKLNSSLKIIILLFSIIVGLSELFNGIILFIQDTFNLYTNYDFYDISVNHYGFLTILLVIL